MQYRRPNKPTDLSERAKLVCMWVDGMSCRNIAKETGKSVSTVCRWIRHWKLEGNINSKPRIGRSYKPSATVRSAFHPPLSWKYGPSPTYSNMSTSSRMVALIALLMVRKCIGSAVEGKAGLSDQTDDWLTGSVYQSGVGVDHRINQVGEVVSQVVEQHLAGCHLVLVDTTTQSPVFSTMVSQLVRIRESVMVVEAWRLFLQTQVATKESVNNWNNGDQVLKDQLTRDKLLQGLWGDATLTCRALFIHLDNNNKSLFFM
ncbi:putative Glutamate receptor-like 75, partial [Homarus americanus]